MTSTSMIFIKEQKIWGYEVIIDINHLYFPKFYVLISDPIGFPHYLPFQFPYLVIASCPVSPGEKNVQAQLSAAGLSAADK